MSDIFNRNNNQYNNEILKCTLLKLDALKWNKYVLIPTLYHIFIVLYVPITYYDKTMIQFSKKIVSIQIEKQLFYQ